MNEHNTAVLRRRAAELGGGWPELAELIINTGSDDKVLAMIGELVALAA